MLRVIVSVLLSLVLISGCSLPEKKSVVEIETAKQERILLRLEPQPPLKLDSIQWTVITKELAASMNDDAVYFALSDKDYEKLSLNFAKIIRYIMLNNSMLNKYKEYYEGDENERTSNGSQ